MTAQGEARNGLLKKQTAFVIERSQNRCRLFMHAGG
ncbi:hypothetical protein IYQ_14108 [Aeromonas salmonicida subsp. salmonicida 01-B526]|uniref:Uncharacterized protein n=1 Tax=Aeromonas salmonicida subsp. salmonicida 01-B526 TaxID=1076135 RepID=A0ABN0DXU8_AERSS|nr:hypothetical protein IYQ_14108 [Aeromonas salmonicida subsp. salmonicida 01-B526]